MTGASEGSLLQLYQQLWQLTRQQAEAIDAGSLDDLAGLIAQRQAVMDEIQRRPPQTEDDGASLERLQELLEKTVTLDRENTRKLEGQLEELKGRMALLRLGRQGMKSYEAEPGYEAKFIDRRS